MSDDTQQQAARRDHYEVIKRALNIKEELSVISVSFSALITSIALAPPVLLALLCGGEHGAVLAIGIMIACWSFVVVAWRLWSLRRIAFEASNRLLPDEARDTQEAERRAEWWRAAQHTALLDLTRRVAQHAAPTHVGAAFLQRLSNPSPLVAFMAAAGLSFVTFALLGWAWMDDVSLERFGQNACSVFSMCLVLYLYISMADGLRSYLMAQESKRELDREIRHVAGLLDAAGGLSLADDEIDEVLRCAISSDVAQEGKLEMVASS